MKKIAVSMPGKVGDAIYALPAIRFLTNSYQCQADFFTSTHVERARDLFEYQSCIDQVVIPYGYKIERYDMGIQPWSMPIDLGQYECTFHLGYRSTPDKRLDWFMAQQIGVNPTLLPRVYYEFPDYSHKFGKIDKFYLLSSSGETSYKQTFIDFINMSDVPVFQIGLKEHYLETEMWQGKFPETLTFLETLYLMSKCSGFIGLQTNQLVLANGFDMPKIVPHDGKSWDMRHVIYSPSHHYLVNPTAKEMHNILNANS